MRKLLADLLNEKGANVWIDGDRIKIGDSIRNLLENGLNNSKYGIVMLSKKYLEKYWTNQELNSLYELEESGKKRILPLLIDLSHEEIKEKSIFLANRYNVKFDKDKLDEIVEKILEVLNN